VQVAGDRRPDGQVAKGRESRMIAGSPVIAGGTGAMPGYLMRRGSIFLDRALENLSPSFVEYGAGSQAAAARQGPSQIWRRQCGPRDGRNPLSKLTERRKLEFRLVLYCFFCSTHRN
jgi:hypothetical protein